MTVKLAVDILFRWLHVAAACLAIGGAFFIRVLLPIATRLLDAEHREGVFLRARRAFKIRRPPGDPHAAGERRVQRLGQLALVHASNPGRCAGMFGTHLLLALAVIALLAGAAGRREPIRSHRGWMKVNLVLMALTIVAASALKWARDHTPPPGTQTLPVRGAK